MTSNCAGRMKSNSASMSCAVSNNTPRSKRKRKESKKIPLDTLASDNVESNAFDHHQWQHQAQQLLDDIDELDCNVEDDQCGTSRHSFLPPHLSSTSCLRVYDTERESQSIIRKRPLSLMSTASTFPDVNTSRNVSPRPSNKTHHSIDITTDRHRPKAEITVVKSCPLLKGTYDPPTSNGRHLRKFSVYTDKDSTCKISNRHKQQQLTLALGRVLPSDECYEGKKNRTSSVPSNPPHIQTDYSPNISIGDVTTPFPVRCLFPESKLTMSNTSKVQQDFPLQTNEPVMSSRIHHHLFRRMHFRPKISRLIPKIPLLPRLQRRIMLIRFARRQNRQQRRQKLQQRWLIPSEHPFKVLWDVLTVVISLLNTYATHVAIADRSIGKSHGWQQFCLIWFVLDILLNFVTEHKLSMSSSTSSSSIASSSSSLSTGTSAANKTEEDGDIVLTNCQAVWARYLTTWFVVDLLSLVPGEALFVKPVIEQQMKRGFFKRNLFRIRSVIRFLRRGILRPKHITMFSTVAKHSKRAGMGGSSHLIRVIIKYVPKYVLFFRKMKGLLALRVLRQFHWFQKVWRSFKSLVKRYHQYRILRSEQIGESLSVHKKLSLHHRLGRSDDETISMTCDEDDDANFVDQNDNLPNEDYNVDGTTENELYNLTQEELFEKEDEVEESGSTGTCVWSHNCEIILFDPNNDTWEILQDDDDDDSDVQNDDVNTNEVDEDEGGYPY